VRYRVSRLLDFSRYETRATVDMALVLAEKLSKTPPVGVSDAYGRYMVWETEGYDLHCVRAIATKGVARWVIECDCIGTFKACAKCIAGYLEEDKDRG